MKRILVTTFAFGNKITPEDLMIFIVWNPRFNRDLLKAQLLYHDFVDINMVLDNFNERELSWKNKYFKNNSK